MDTSPLNKIKTSLDEECCGEIIILSVFFNEVKVILFNEIGDFNI
jgi:hypothetical protein